MYLLAGILRSTFTVVAIVGLFIFSKSSIAENKLVAPSDKMTALKALNFAEKGKWTNYNAVRNRINNPILSKALLWYQLVSPNSGARFFDIEKFMKVNPTWPQQTILQMRAEQVMPSTLKDDKVVQWFKNRPPLTPNGTARLAASYIITDKKSEAKKLIREIWIHGNFGPKQERQFYRQFRHYMTRKDHIQRLDRLLWEGKYYHARRMYRRMNPDYRALAEARRTLRLMRGGVDRAITRVPQNLKNDPGLVYERLRWRRKKGKNKFAQELLRTPPENLVHPIRWWRERAILARRALREGHISEAYTLVKAHGLGTAERLGFVDAEWLAGWIALQFLKDKEIGFQHFLAAYQASKFPISKSRCAYWAGRAAGSQSEFDKAKHWYKVASKHQTTFYGQLAGNQLPLETKLTLPRANSFNSALMSNFDDNDELITVVRLAGEVGLQKIIEPFIRHLNKMGTTPNWRAMVAELAKSASRPDLAILVAKQSLREGLYLIDAGYPLLQQEFNVSLEAPLIHAIIRQESGFNLKAISRAGAMGLMQIIPRTAFHVAKKHSMPYIKRKLTEDGYYNLSLGQAYLRELLEQFNHSYILALAAYNAGPVRVRRWMKNYGDPRDIAVDPIDWIEMIPLGETRNYVQRVIENLHVYRHRMPSSRKVFQSKMEFDDDLFRQSQPFGH